MTTSRFRQDEGAIAILYSVLMLGAIALLALVVDIGALRVDRRSAMRTADAASTAGALALKPGSSGAAACEAAWRYVVANISDLGAATPPCTAGPPPTGITWDCATAPANPTVERTVGSYVIRITWPVPAGHALMEGQDYGPDVDGVDCERIGVSIARTRGYVFGAWITPQGVTGASAVARSLIGDNGEDVASLLLLDKWGCKALDTGGGGAVRVTAALDSKGEWKIGKIYVDSDSTECSGNSYTINTGGKGRILAEGNDGVPTMEPGIIRLFALPPGATTCSGNACNPTEVMTSYDVDGSGIWPQPLHLPKRTNRTPADHQFNCKKNYTGLDGTAPGNENWNVEECVDATEDSAYIDNLRTAIGTGASNPSPFDPLTNPDGFHNWSTLGVGCKPHPKVPIPPLVGNWYIDCADFQVSDREITFLGGNVITQGQVLINAGGTLNINALNPSAAIPVSCLTKICPKASSSKSSYLYIGDGDLVQNSSSSSFNLNNAFVLLKDGATTITKGAFTWIAPNEGPFEDLALWSDRKPPLGTKYDVNSLVGTGSTTMEGVYFTPNSLTKIGGGAGSTPKDAQFFTWDMTVEGTGTVRLRPNPERGIPVPSFLGIRLIR